MWSVRQEFGCCGVWRRLGSGVKHRKGELDGPLARRSEVLDTQAVFEFAQSGDCRRIVEDVGILCIGAPTQRVELPLLGSRDDASRLVPHALTLPLRTAPVG
jgi:hypothetical protein